MTACLQTPTNDFQTEQDATACLDASGLTCPEPIMLLHNKIASLIGGDILRFVATDPSTQRDVPKFCEYLGHQLLSQETLEDSFHYLIAKCD